MSEFKATIAIHSTAMAKIVNAEIVHFTCSIMNHGLFSASLARHPNVLAGVAKASSALYRHR